MSAGIEVGDKPPPYAMLETEYIYSGEDDALTTELRHRLGVERCPSGRHKAAAYARLKGPVTTKTRKNL